MSWANIGSFSAAGFFPLFFACKCTLNWIVLDLMFVAALKCNTEACAFAGRLLREIPHYELIRSSHQTVETRSAIIFIRITGGDNWHASSW